MSTVAPAPGWWLASDGRWYPPQWEYTWFKKEARLKFHDPNVNEAMGEAHAEATALGAQGWELVNYTCEYVVMQGTGKVVPIQYFLVTCFLKRMIPQQGSA